MDEAGQFMAKIQSSVVVPIMYKMVHTGKLPKFMQKKINEADKSKKEMIDGFLNMFGIEQGGNPWITKQSVYNQCLLIKQLSVTSNSYICSGHARIGTNAKEHKVFASES